MTQPRILLFDSGMGGLSVATAVARHMPEAELLYAADTAAFPYGVWDESALVQRILLVVARLIDRAQPDVVVVACNTASTIALKALRGTFDLPFVGTVPAIKPAAAQTRSGVIGVLATPGTVKREYTQALINSFAAHCKVTLHGAPKLAEIAEQKLRGHPIDREQLRAEIAPAFAEGTDVVVLGCTHYPLIVEDIERAAPWPVTYIDPAPAIARRAADIADETKRRDRSKAAAAPGTVFVTSPQASGETTRQAYARMGFSTLEVLDLPV